MTGTFTTALRDAPGGRSSGGHSPAGRARPVRGLPAQAADGRTEVRSFAGLAVTEVVRDRQDAAPICAAARGGERDWVLLLQLEGTAAVPRSHPAVLLAAGDMLLTDADLADGAPASGRSRQLCLHLPPALLRSRLPDMQILPPRVIEGGRGIGVLMSGLLLATTAASGTFTAVEEAGIRDALVALAAAVVPAARRSPCARSKPSSHWKTLRAYVDARLGDPTLCPAAVAAAHGISTRHLHRVFHGAGMSFGEYIRSSRLQRCREDLADPRLYALPVTEIAFRWGFSECSHFSRSFKAAFGITARAFRARNGGGRLVEPPAACRG